MSNFLWAAVKLRTKTSTETREALFERTIQVAPEMTPQGVSNCLWALGNDRNVLPGDLITALARRAAHVTASMDAQNACNLLWSFASIRVVDGTLSIPECKTAVNACVARLQQIDATAFSFFHATTLIWATDKINVNLGAKLINVLAGKASASVASIKTYTLVGNLTSLARIWRRHGAFADQVTAIGYVECFGGKIAQERHLLSAEQVSEVLWAAYALVGDALYDQGDLKLQTRVATEEVQLLQQSARANSDGTRVNGNRVQASVKTSSGSASTAVKTHLTDQTATKTSVNDQTATTQTSVALGKLRASLVQRAIEVEQDMEAFLVKEMLLEGIDAKSRRAECNRRFGSTFTQLMVKRRHL